MIEQKVYEIVFRRCLDTTNKLEDVCESIYVRNYSDVLYHIDDHMSKFPDDEFIAAVLRHTIVKDFHKDVKK